MTITSIEISSCYCDYYCIIATSTISTNAICSVLPVIAAEIVMGKEREIVNERT